MADFTRLDAKESIFFERELEVIKAKTYDVKHAVLKAISLIPVSVEANRGASEITYRSFDMVGTAMIVADYAHDFPRVDVYGTEVTVKVKSIGDSYGYSVDEIRASERAGKGLEQRRALAARRAIDEKLNSVALIGDSKANLKGLLNYSGIAEYTPAADGTGSSKLWSAKDAAKILRDLLAFVDSIPATTNGLGRPDTLLMPLSLYTYLGQTFLGTDNLVSVMKKFREERPQITTIEWLTELETLGAGGTHRLVTYARDPDVLTLELPTPFESFSQPQKGLEFEVLCRATTAGVIIYRPTEVAFMDGV